MSDPPATATSLPSEDAPLLAVGFVLVTTASGRERSVYDSLLKLPGVVEVMPLFGEYDLIAKVEAPDFDTLGQTIIQGIRPLSGVMATKTLAAARP